MSGDSLRWVWLAVIVAAVGGVALGLLIFRTLTGG